MAWALSTVRTTSSSPSLLYAIGDEPRIVIASKILPLGVCEDGKSTVRSMAVLVCTEESTNLLFAAGTWLSSLDCSSTLADSRRFTFAMDSAPRCQLFDVSHT